MQLGIWAPANMKVAKGDAELIKYESTPGSVSRNSCSKCGSFCYTGRAPYILKTPSRTVASARSLSAKTQASL
eukprot:scaffold90495_cov77-Phaeocystis_antarctica.AAC.1